MVFCIMEFSWLDWLKITWFPFLLLIIGAVILGLVTNPEHGVLGGIGLIFLSVGIYYVGVRTGRLTIDKESIV